MDTAINHLKETACFLHKKGFLLPGSSSGNISIRNPNDSESMIITLSGESLDILKEGNESFCEVSLSESSQHTLCSVDWSIWNFKTHGLDRNARRMLPEGETYKMSLLPQTKQGKPSFETYLHLAVYKNIKSVMAVIHLHSPNATNFACLSPKKILKLRNQCISSFPPNDDSNVVPYINVARIAKCGPILWCPHFPAASNELHEYIWRALYTNKSMAIILQNHGLLSIGLTPMEAAMVAAEVEQELGIILDTLRMTGGDVESLSYIDAADVLWYWQNISKGNPWRKLYN